jgi:hypothetical protein
VSKAPGLDQWGLVYPEDSTVYRISKNFVSVLFPEIKVIDALQKNFQWDIKISEVRY